MSDHEPLDIGDVARCEMAWTDDGDLPINPTTVVLSVMDPDGVITAYTYPNAILTNPSTGSYVGRVPCTAAGLWKIRWVASGNIADATEDWFEVRSTDFL